MRRLFTSLSRPSSLMEPLEQLSSRSVKESVLLRIAYTFPFFWYATHLGALYPLLSIEYIEAQWPIFWISWISSRIAVSIILTLGILSSALALFAPHLRMIRIFVFLGFLQVLGLQYSFGKIHHLMHAWLFTLFIFAFLLPNNAFFPEQSSRKTKHRSLLVFHSAIVMLSLTYSLAGLGKLIGTLYQATQWQITPLHPSALARHIADRLLQTYPDSILGSWMIDNGIFLWPAMLGTIYIQLFAIHAAYRPRLHVLWGFSLSCFHLITGLTMTIDFTPNLVLLAILFIASPFAKSSLDIPGIIEDLPIFGQISHQLGILKR